jgi:hypothetical protein
MATVDDFYTELQGVNTRLDDVNSHLGTLEGLVTDVNNTLITGFGDLVKIGNYTNEALYDITQQNDTIICNLEKISKQTCQLVNEAYKQTRLQTSIERGTTKLVDMFSSVHAEAALDLERRTKLKEEIDACCPPRPEPPACVYEPCKKPEPIETPPKVKRAEDEKEQKEPKDKKQQKEPS